MKVLFIRLLCISLICRKALSQVSFTLPTSVCINTSLSLTVNTGTLSSPQITWLASPNAVFSNSTSANTNVTFTASGNYTVLVVAISGTALGFTQNTINAIANPSPYLSPMPASLCPMSTFSLIATPMAGANYSFGLPGAVTVANGASNVLQVFPPIILPATYQVSVELNGCYGSSSITKTQLQLHPILSVSSMSVCAGYNTTISAYPTFQTSYTFSILSPSPASVPNANGPVFVASPSVPTVYQVLADSMSCTGSSTISIGINPPLSLNVAPSSQTTCILQNAPKYSKLVTLTVTGASSYLWFPYNPATITCSTCPVTQVRPESTTCYTVNGSTSICSGSAAICVTVVPQFTIAVSPASASICLGQELTLTSGSVGPGAVGPPSAYTYSWTDLPPHAMSSYITPTTTAFPLNSTTYTVQAWDTQTCVSIPQVATVQVYPCLNLSEEQNTINQIMVYPNPVFDVCEIKTLGSGFTEVQLHDINGRLVKSVYSPDGKSTQTFQIDLSDIPSGLYFLKTNSPGAGRNFQKLIKL